MKTLYGDFIFLFAITNKTEVLSPIKNKTSFSKKVVVLIFHLAHFLKRGLLKQMQVKYQWFPKSFRM